MLHIKALANRGPRGEPIATPSGCSYSWPLNVKSWSFVAALRRSTRSSLSRLRWYVSLNQLMKRTKIVERFKFHSRNRKDGEGVGTYVAALRKLSEHCNYGETLPEMLRDRLVCGINNEKMQRRLLAEAEEIALAMELASKHVVDIQSTDATPSKVNQVNSAARNKGKNPASTTECYRCGEKHKAFTCRFKDAQCFKCGKRGHLAKSCRSKSAGKINEGTEPVKRENKQPGHRREEGTADAFSRGNLQGR